MSSSNITILTNEQVRELNEKLSNMRHTVNNCLSLIVAVVEVTNINPSAFKKMLPTLKEQPEKIMKEIQKFSEEFEKALQITNNKSNSL
ncbi:MAG TPA: hypothetical protein PLW02_09810 [Verrucomicrobiota bacterium]|nr:hypothetical protein [Verrucomicrobiota bacterium]